MGGAYTLETESLGSHSFSATTFFADTTFLNEGLITERERARIEDGGASNTEDFSSFTLAWDAESLFGAENLRAHLGYRSLGEQDENRDATTDDESGVAATLGYVFDMNDNLSFDWLGEYAGLQDFEGVKNADRDYYSTSVKTTFYQDWNVTVGYTARDIKDDGAGVSHDDHLFQLSGGYDFGNGLTTEAGWRTTEESTIDTDILGFLVRYNHSF